MSGMGQLPPIYASPRSDDSSPKQPEALPVKNPSLSRVREALTADRTMTEACFHHILLEMDARHKKLLSQLEMYKNSDADISEPTHAIAPPWLPQEVSTLSPGLTGISTLRLPSKPAFVESDGLSHVLSDHVLSDADLQPNSLPAAGQKLNQQDSSLLEAAGSKYLSILDAGHRQNSAASFSSAQLEATGSKYLSESTSSQQASEGSEHVIQPVTSAGFEPVTSADIPGCKFELYPTSKTASGQPKRGSQLATHVFASRHSADEYAYQRSQAKGLWGGLCFRARWMVYSPNFEVALAGLILVNAFTMAMEAQYLSFDTAYKLGWQDTDSPASDVWPGAKFGFHITEFFFGAVFTLEVVCKSLVGPRTFVASAWNWFDTIIVGFWLLSLFDIRLMIGNPMILRLMRLIRLLRLVRLVKTVQMFDVLHLLIHSLMASGSVLLWALVLLLVCMLAVALVVNFLLEPYILDTSEPLKHREEIFQLFGSFSRSFVTMFEMTLGNWGPPTRVIIEHVSEWYAPVLVLYVCVMNFAVIQVIRSVFIHETFSVASMDADIMIMQQEHKIQKHASNMEMLFAEADQSGDGYITFDEFESICEDPRVKAWLAAMDFEITDARLVFELIDDGDQKLSAMELAQGVRRLKGTARSIDMISLQNLCRRIERYLVAIATGRDFKQKKGSSRLTQYGDS